MSVERFKMRSEHDWVCARADEDGEWVRHSDYAALQSRLSAAEERAERAAKIARDEFANCKMKAAETSGEEYAKWMHSAGTASEIADAIFALSRATPIQTEPFAWAYRWMDEDWSFQHGEPTAPGVIKKALYTSATPIQATRRLRLLRAARRDDKP
jgi:hypothetical protein